MIKAQLLSDYKALDFKVNEIFLEINLDKKRTVVKSILNVIKSNKNLSEIHLNGCNLDLLNLKVNNIEYKDYNIEIDEFNNQILVIRNLYLDKFEIEIINSFNPEVNKTLQGIYLDGDNYFSQCEANGFRQISFMIDRPDNLSIYTTKIIADKKYTSLLSNGNKIDEGDLGNKHYVTWKDPFPKPTYLFACVVGNFDKLSDKYVTLSGREVVLEIFVEKNKKDHATFAMESLKRSFRWDEERFGLEYDLNIFMIVAVSSFNMGAMENKSLNIFNDKYILVSPYTATDLEYYNTDSVVAHEYFHNWTGNRITCRDWFQLTLKEGLTVFRDQEYSADFFDKTSTRLKAVNTIRTAQFAEDASPMSHPIRPTKVLSQDNFYTVTVYEKGAEIIRMIHTLLGENGFQKGMKLYVKRFDGQAVTCDDFIQCMQDANNFDLTKFKRWYEQSGTPILTVKDEFIQSKNQYILKIYQKTNPTIDQEIKQALYMPFKVELYSSEGKKLELNNKNLIQDNILIIDKDYQEFIFESIAEKPIPSLNIDFTAPVKVEYEYKLSDLLILSTKSNSLYSRFEATKTLYNLEFKNNFERLKNNKTIEVSSELIEAYGINLKEAISNPQFFALLLSLPIPGNIIANFIDVDPDNILIITNYIKKEIYKNYNHLILDTYNYLYQEKYEFTPNAMAKRSLRNLLLDLLSSSSEYEKIVLEQYKNSDNLTDISEAMFVSASNKLSITDEILLDFKEKWYNRNHLVFDYYYISYALQANSVDKIRDLIYSKDFDFSNPNRIRSVISGFSKNLSLIFNKDGSGIKLLSEVIYKLDKYNPIVASRLCDILLQYNSFIPSIKDIMLDEIKYLGTKDLSNNLLEKVSKALIC